MVNKLALPPTPNEIISKINEIVDNIGGGGSSSSRNIGEIVKSTIPLTDAGLHLLDGSLIQGNGIYSDFVDYIKNLYEENPPEEAYEKDEIVTLPTFSSNTQDGITISDARGNTTSLQAIFNGTKQANQVGLWNTYWINIDYGQDTIIDSYTIQADNQGSAEYPSAWTFKGSNNGIDWITLDEKTGITFSLNEIKTFPISTTNIYNQYRIVFSNGVHSSNNGELKQFYTTAYKIGNVFKNSIFAKEEQWQNNVTTYGVCGKFVYDNVNNTVRLPKYSNKIYTGGGTAPVVGNGMTLGLTNGTGNAGLNGTSSGSHWDVFNPNVYGLNVSTTGPANGHLSGVIGVTSDPEKSGLIADLTNITTSLDGYYYIVIATSTKTDIQVDIDEIATDLNNKVDTDLSNINASQTAKETIIGWSMPDFTAGVQINFNSSMDYAAPCDGFICVKGNTVAADLYAPNGGGEVRAEYWFSQSYGSTCNPITKGYRCKYRSGSSSYSACIFYPLKGVNND